MPLQPQQLEAALNVVIVQFRKRFGGFPGKGQYAQAFVRHALDVARHELPVEVSAAGRPVATLQDHLRRALQVDDLRVIRCRFWLLRRVLR